MPSILSINNTVANSPDQTANTPITLCLYGATDDSVPVQCEVLVQMQAGSVYTTIGRLDYANPSIALPGPGVYRARRIHGRVGVFANAAPAV